MLPIDGVPERRHARDMSEHERSFNPVPRDGEDLYVLHRSPVPVLVVHEA
jgi:hypothetical protein